MPTAAGKPNFWECWVCGRGALVSTEARMVWRCWLIPGGHYYCPRCEVSWRP